MQKILLIGRNPLEHSGNGHMLNSLARQLDTQQFTPICIGVGDKQVFLMDSDTLPYKLIQTGTSDIRVLQQMITSAIEHLEPSVVAIIGLDVWDLAPLYDSISSLKRRQHFATAGIMPYDLMHFRDDWAGWFNFFDIPCVYSRYGYDMLHGQVRNLRYFRPLLDEFEKFQPYQEARKRARRNWHVDEDTFVFGFVGANQIRKDPLRLIKAFTEFKKISPVKSALYLHMDMDTGVYSFQSYAEDCGLRLGEIVTKSQGRKYTTKEMVEVFNGMDCLVNCSLQEGLSWTPLEAMLCGIPVIASNSTAHTELLEGCGLLIEPTELAYIPVITKHGASWVESKACNATAIANMMHEVVTDRGMRLDMVESGLRDARTWIDGADDFNSLMNDAIQLAKPPGSAYHKRDAVLFAQQGAAGDVLMTTSILQQVKDRHPGKPLVYMTQRQYIDIVTGHPAIDEIVFWDESKLTGYEIVYNPHGEKILPGRWNSLDMMLHEMYAYFTKTKTGKSTIKLVEPKDIGLPENFVVVHSTGNAYTRVYKNWPLIVRGITHAGFDLVQLGSLTDWPIPGSLDLRGELTYRESAYVMKQAKAAVTVDSFLSHLAGCLDIPQVCLFGPAPSRVTKPFADPDKLICIEPDRFEVCPMCGACYGEYKCTSPCINSISPFVVLDEIVKLLQKD